jgi:hypothetical protein
MDFAIDWRQALHDIGRLLIAYVFALPIGLYCEREALSVGVRTFPLVAWPVAPLYCWARRPA